MGNVILLQFASQTSIRQYLARQENRVPFSQRLQWVQQLTDAVCFIHSKGILHGDISCNNAFLDGNLNVKLGDFAGSATNDLPPLVCYESSHELPDADISVKTELFALWSTIFEIMTGSKPYDNLADHEISAAFLDGRFPDLSSVSTFRSIIMKCWTQQYTCAKEALVDAQFNDRTPVDSLSLSNADDLQATVESMSPTPRNRLFLWKFLASIIAFSMSISILAKLKYHVTFPLSGRATDFQLASVPVDIDVKDIGTTFDGMPRADCPLLSHVKDAKAQRLVQDIELQTS